jgi:hypothetical protein
MSAQVRPQIRASRPLNYVEPGEKSRQQGSAMYTAFADTDAAPTAGVASGGEPEETPETAADKVPAEV